MGFRVAMSHRPLFLPVSALARSLAALLIVLVLATPSPAENAQLADSVRREAGRLAAQGRLEQAITLVERHAADFPAVWRAMFTGKLELDGEASARGYAGAAADSAPEQMRGEAVFRMGQHHYAAGRHHLAIPQFRLYLSRHPDGVWSEAAAYWMAHSSLQYALQQPGRPAYLDTALARLELIEARGPGNYYWPLARAARARVLLARGDTASAAAALADARARAPAEERPGVFLLSLRARPSPGEAAAWEDSLRWNYPLSPEAARLDPGGAPVRAAPVAAPTPQVPNAAPQVPPVRAGHALQLGAFSLRENAERMRAELAGRGFDARVAEFAAGDRTLYRVLAGRYPDAETARRDGEHRMKPLGYEFRVVEEK